MLKHAGELATAHSCVTVFTDRCSPVRPRPPLLCRNARTRKASRSVRKSSNETPPLCSEAKGWLMRCTGCLLYSRCDQRQLDAMIACQCPLARLVTLEVDRSLWRDPNSSVIRRDSEWPTEREPVFKGFMNCLCFLFCTVLWGPLIMLSRCLHQKHHNLEVIGYFLTLLNRNGGL